MKIIELRSENFKRLRAVRIRAAAGLQEIAGRNAQGKSSVIDSIWAVLGGAKASPQKPIRDGAARAECRLDLGEIIATRRWTASGNSTLHVESKDGVPLKSPQEILGKLTGVLSFDPLAFCREPPAKQASTLKAIAGLDTGDLDRQHQEAYDKRTAVNREMKMLNGRLAGVEIVNAPDVEVSIADLAKKLTDANATRNENERKRAAVNREQEQVSKIHRQLHALKLQLAELEPELDKAQAVLEAAQDKAFGLRDPDLEAITKEMQEIEQTNARVRQKKQRRTIEEELKRHADQVAEIERAMEQLQERRRRALNEAKYPVAGLSVDGEVVIFNGQPLEQASTSEQIRVSLSIAGALNPELRVVLVEEGSALDADALAEVDRWATEQDCQVWLERVDTETATAAGVLIEDGEVKE